MPAYGPAIGLRRGPRRLRSAATDAAEAAGPAADLAALMLRISDEGLPQAQTHMGLILKAEVLSCSLERMKQ